MSHPRHVSPTPSSIKVVSSRIARETGEAVVAATQDDQASRPADAA